MTSHQPLPAVTDENRHFWQGGKTGRLQFLHCLDCGYLVHPPGPICPRCKGENLAVAAVSGQGTIFSFTTNFKDWGPPFAPPYVVALVSVDEQPELRLLAGSSIARLRLSR